jgi:hypothetical protein
MSEFSFKSDLGFISTLQIVFITLKLVDKITWSWFWVLSPIWITIILLLIMLIIIIIVFYLC